MFAVSEQSDRADAGTVIGSLEYELGDQIAVVLGYSGDPGDLVIPSSVTYEGNEYRVVRIANVAFFGCTSLTSVTIPASVKHIGDEVFCDCTSLTTITVDGGNTVYSSEGGVLFTKDGKDGTELL